MCTCASICIACLSLPLLSPRSQLNANRTVNLNLSLSLTDKPFRLEREDCFERGLEHNCASKSAHALDSAPTPRSAFISRSELDDTSSPWSTDGLSANVCLEAIHGWSETFCCTDSVNFHLFINFWIPYHVCWLMNDLLSLARHPNLHLIEVHEKVVKSTSHASFWDCLKIVACLPLRKKALEHVVDSKKIEPWCSFITMSLGVPTCSSIACWYCLEGDWWEIQVSKQLPQKAQAKKKLPVTLLSGFLGAGDHCFTSYNCYAQKIIAYVI